jgi:hypothetical protein
MLVDVADARSRGRLRQRVAGVGSQCLIGRSLSCDFVLDDDFAAGEHALLTLLEDGRVHVQDLGTRNGIRFNGERIPAGAGVVIERGALIVGRSCVQVRTGHGPLPPERTFNRELLRRHRTALAVAGTGACVGLAALWRWREAPASLHVAVLTSALMIVFALVLWSASWWLVTRLNHGRWQVRLHLAVAAGGMAVCATAYWVFEFMAFVTQWVWLDGLLAIVVIVIAGMTIFVHLRKATLYTPNVALAIAAIVTLALTSTAWIIGRQLEGREVDRIVLGPDVYPSLPRIAPSDDLASYLDDVAALRRAASRNRQRALPEVPPFAGED